MTTEIDFEKLVGKMMRFEVSCNSAVAHYPMDSQLGEFTAKEAAYLRQLQDAAEGASGGR